MWSVNHPYADALILDTALQSFLILAVAGGACLCLRRASAATRHLIWFLCVASLPLLPLFSSLFPAWQKPLWSVSAGPGIGNQFAVGLELAPVTPAKTSISQPPVPTEFSVAATSGSHRQFNAQFKSNWVVLAFFVWLSGALLTLGSMLAAHRHVRRLARRSQVLRDGDWAALLVELRGQLRVRRAVTLLQCAENVMPAAWGTRRPIIFLPGDAGHWPPGRRRVVLQHELAHVRRRDCLTQTIAGLVHALFWFNPLVWLAARRMCVEREIACDDMVLKIGCKASDYAGHLVEIARSFRPLPSTAAIAMARSRALSERVAAIIDASRARGMRRRTMVAATGLVCGMLLAAGGCNSHAVTGHEFTANLPQSGESKLFGDMFPRKLYDNRIFVGRVHAGGTNLENVIVLEYDRKGQLEGLKHGITGTISSDPKHQQTILNLQKVEGMLHYDKGWRPSFMADEVSFPIEIDLHAPKVEPLHVSNETFRQLMEAHNMEPLKFVSKPSDNNKFKADLLEMQWKMKQRANAIRIATNGAADNIPPPQKQEAPP
jgi:beta-lactamase regulating signal transducer with metallopeptidase domain